MFFFPKKGKWAMNNMKLVKWTGFSFRKVNIIKQLQHVLRSDKHLKSRDLKLSAGILGGRLKGGSRILKWGGGFCNDVREIKHYFNIWGIRKKRKRKKGLRKRWRGGGVKIHPFHLPWIRAWDSFIKWTRVLFVHFSTVWVLYLTGYSASKCSQRKLNFRYLNLKCT